MTKSELLNNVFFENAKGDLPIIYITSDDDVVKVGGIVNAPMVGRIYFSEVKKTITKSELLANKEFICASEDSEILIDFGGFRRETLDCYIAIDDNPYIGEDGFIKECGLRKVHTEEHGDFCIILYHNPSEVMSLRAFYYNSKKK